MHSNFLEKHFGLLFSDATSSEDKRREKDKNLAEKQVTFFPINTRFIFLYLKENKGLNVNNNSAGNHQPKRKLIFLSDQSLRRKKKRKKKTKGVKIL